MTTKHIVTFLILFTGQLFSQPTPNWSSGIGSNLPYYYSEQPKVKFDKAGDLVVCGNIMTSSNGMNMLLIKYTATGSLIWLKTYNGPTNKDDQLFDFVFDNQNNIYVTGKTTVSTNNSDVISIKFDSGGNFVWQNTFNGYCNRNDEGYSISLDESNNSYVIGTTELDSIGWCRKIFMRKLDPSGTTIWSKRYGNDSTARCAGMQIKYLNGEVRAISYQTSPNKYIVMNMDPNGTYIFANEAPFIKGMGPTHIDKFGNFYFGAYGAYKTTKIYANGNLAWIDSVGTNLPFNVTGDEVRALTVDSLQNVYTTGRHYGSDYNGPNYTNCDVLTLKYSPSGSIQWSTRYDNLGTNSCDIGNSICLDSSLNVYVGVQSQRVSIATDYDYTILKYNNNNGTQMGTIRYNDPYSKDDAISSIITDKYSCMYVTGLTMDNLTTSNTTTQKYCSINTGFNEVASERITVNAYPNPFNSEVFVDLPNNNVENLHLKLYNAIGQIVFEQFYSEARSLKLNLSNLSSGLYHFVIKGSDRLYFGKLVKTE